MLLALYGIIKLVLDVIWWIIIVQAVLSWLVAFNVINTRNDFIRSFLYSLDRITEPLYRPIRRILPDFGALDFSPMVALLLISAIEMLLAGAVSDILRASAG